MTSSNDPPDGGAGQPGKRRPPTIDLKATEVASESTAAAEPSPEARDAPSGASAAASASSASKSPASKSPASESSASESSASKSEPESDPVRPRPLAGALPLNLLWPLAAAGAAGAVVTLAIMALSGLFSARDNGATLVDPRLVRVEQQMRELAAKPLPAAGDTKATDDLAGRLARLETQLATPRAPVTDASLANRIATLEGDLKALGERIGVLGRRNDEIASIAGEARTRADSIAALIAELKKVQASAPTVQRADIDALMSRVAALEQAAKAMEAQLGARVGGEGLDRSLRLVVVANTLNAAVERGTPFLTELGAAKAVASDPKALAILEPFAKSGVPSANTLARELTALVPALVKAVGASSRDSSMFDRLMANAEKIVRVRPVDDAAGDDLITVLQRIEVRAQQANLAGALTEIAKLPEPARALTKEWVAKVEARNAAIDASRRFAAEALAAIEKPSL